MFVDSSIKRTQGSVIPIGFILVLGIIVITSTVLSSTAVPAINESRELQSHTEFREDIATIPTTVTQVVATDVSRQLNVGKTVSYFLTSRSLIQHVSVISDQNYTISNVQTTDGGTLLVTNDHSILKFSRDYNYIGKSQIFTVERSNILSEQDEPLAGSENAILQNKIQLIDQRNISIISLSSNTQVHENPPTLISLSRADTDSHTVTNSSNSLVALTFPTRISENDWRDELSAELSTNGGYINSITYTTQPDSVVNTVEIKLVQNEIYYIKTTTVDIR
ncbi:hypothetical protein [Haloquadratum walsbyi]|jgi:hypothetical protein|uniref:Archaeal flagellin N-terminal-like domain protein n=1 Tax=Haloquadratum walsbyi J07HQW2 TaxID=1238425 RepID=U1PN59_9EURY|nr:hypothetical protein [Haloquadratum walsbyi]ERG93686.1 MAG: hypothetical protein J07HQW2_00119 [Haloquadratum walsbyi J07HQW2]